MTIFNVINLAGGIALFLYGMSIMGTGLEKLAGGKMEAILQRLTSSVWKAVLLGAILTGLIQSSAGTTVICIGLVNSGIFTLSQAIGIIMGANIGTTVTGQLIRLSDISGSGWVLTMLKPSTFSPIVAFIGAVLFVFVKSPKKRNIGQICMGFGILFTGLFTMENAVAPLKDSPLFVQLFSQLQNPFLGVLAGALVTVAIQSSSASVGILQALSSTGVVTWGSAIPIILGQNIGTCSTPLIASMGASTAAKRSAIVHLYFNVIGTAVFLAGVYGLKAAGLFPFWNDVMTKGDIANFHTLFNVLVTLMFMPFTKALAWLAEHTIPEKEGEAADLSMPVLDQRLLQSPAVALQQAKNAVEKMASRTRTNFDKTVGLFTKFDAEVATSVAHREELLDKMEVSITDYLIRISDQELTESESHAVSELLKFVGEYERIGDYTVNLMDCARQLSEQEWSFSATARKQAALLFGAVGEVQRITGDAFTQMDASLAAQVEPLEETVDRMCDVMREEHITRLKAGECGIEPGLLFLDVLTNTERISDHCSNIAARLIGDETDDPDMHARKHTLLAGQDAAFNARLATYEQKYLAPLGEK
ncbi:Na/Pi cotransporter family protein [Candidatus Allofournierella merdipullorum]|uniref:Na/Pi cotransporter family protein n=1 Tax=Candidatus Allofournierella merdipullorum TaxID=2838595 RepID=UPI002A8B9B30|nr:Na/Pi cotransporter family protein [Candidatus Fournierella merdipullorum]